MKTKKKKAFTLTELLVVVVVIGVLSAVVLPKFSKVIETRRTTEAEELMGAIRTEQEKRCALDKPYVTDFNKLTDLVKADHTKNYHFELASTGISAQRKDNYNYTLQMPSYADGRVCCSGDDCEKLNKNYPLCDDLKRTSDYQTSPASCAGETLPVEPTACEKDPTSCECNPNQAKCCAEGEVWQDGKCVVPPPPPGCSDEHSEGERTTEFSFSGGISGGSSLTLNDKIHACSLEECPVTGYYWHCGADTEYKWEKQKKTTCEPRPSETKPCEGNASGNQTAKYTCTSSGWTSNGWDTSACRYTCDPATKPQEDPNKKMRCNYCGWAVIGYECDEKTGEWKEVGGPCDKTKEECGILCGTSQAECTPNQHDYKSGNQCQPGKGHPDNYVIRHGNDCTPSNGIYCLMKEDSSAGLATDINDGSSNSNRQCECPMDWWSGRYCDERCRWVNEHCPSSGGGGGGGGGLRGGCTTNLVVMAYYRDATGQYHASYGYETKCE